MNFVTAGSFAADVGLLLPTVCVNTTPQMTYFLGPTRVHKIATGKSYDELLQHDNNKMRIWDTRWINQNYVRVGDKAQRESQ